MIYKTLKKLFRILKKTGCKIFVIESCTGGMIMKYITDIPGASNYFSGGAVVYSNEEKIKFGVRASTIKKYGAVSKNTIIEMLEAAKKNRDIIIATTGIAGPSGGTKNKPVGTVYIGYKYGNKMDIKKFNFNGTRNRIRKKATLEALKMIIKNCRHYS